MTFWKTVLAVITAMLIVGFIGEAPETFRDIARLMEAAAPDVDLSAK